MPMSNLKPWEKGIFLPDSELKNLLGVQFPDLKIQSLRFLKDGWDSCAYEINQNLIFRLPKRQEVSERLGAEISLLPILKQKSEILVPEFMYLGTPSHIYPFQFVGYSKLIGVDQSKAKVRIDHEEIRRIANFLQALHQIDSSTMPDFPIESGTAQETVKRHKQLITDWMPILANEPRLAQACQKFLGSFDWDSLMAPYVPCVVHNDLLPEHILMQGTKISAIIDWGDTIVGDPAIDYAGIGYSFGWDSMQSCLKLAGRTEDTRLINRAYLAIVCAALSDLHYGQHKNDAIRIDFALDTLKSILI